MPNILTNYKYTKMLLTSCMIIIETNKIHIMIDKYLHHFDENVVLDKDLDNYKVQ